MTCNFEAAVMKGRMSRQAGWMLEGSTWFGFGGRRNKTFSEVLTKSMTTGA